MATNQPTTQPVIPPAAGNQKPAAGNQKPAAGNQKPAAGNQKPAAGNQKPAGNKASSNSSGSSESSINSISANNTTPIGAANNNNFEKALNTAEKVEAASNKEPVAANNTNKLVKGLNTRVKTSEQVLAANGTQLQQDKPGIMDRITAFAKNAANNILPSAGNSASAPAKNLKVDELGEEPGMGEDISIVANTENYVIILAVFLVIVLIILIYFFSKTFNVSRTIHKMKMYQRYQKINAIDMSQQQTTEPLYKFQIASFYNACHSGNQMFSYTSELITKAALRSGARYLELNVFCSMYGPKGVPVVDSGYARGEWKLMLNTTTFESVIRVISENAFRVASEEDGAPNNTDPLFIGLNLSTGGNTYCLDLMADILTDYFKDKLLDAKYAFQFATDFAKNPLRELENKVVIFSSSGFEGSKLEELVNAVWYNELFDAGNIVAGTAEGFQINKSLTKKNKNKFTDTKQTQNQKSGTNKLSSKPDQLTALKKSLGAESDIISKAAKQSNKSGGRTGGPSDSQIQSEKSRLTENIKSLTDELKESGLEVLDAEELSGDKTYGKPEDRKPENVNQPNVNESLADIPSPTALGLDQILDSQKPKDNAGTRATIMRVCALKFDDLGFDSGRIKTHVANGGIVIVVPHQEGDFITRNYDPQRAFEMGCQFVAMNYQEIDENMDKYITRFESKGILTTN
jgi:hypothetical protein